MVKKALSGVYVFGEFERAIEQDRTSKAGQPYKSRMYVTNVRFTKKKQDTLFIYLPKDASFARLEEGKHYGFPVVVKDPLKPGGRSSYSARDDMLPFPAPEVESDD